MIVVSIRDGSAQNPTQSLKENIDLPKSCLVNNIMEVKEIDQHTGTFRQGNPLNTAIVNVTCIIALSFVGSDVR